MSSVERNRRKVPKCRVQEEIGDKRSKAAYGRHLNVARVKDSLGRV